MWALAQIVIIRIVNEIDALSAGIYILVVRIQAVTFFFYIGIARGTMTLVGQKLGGGYLREAIRVGLLGLRYAFLLCLIASVFFVLMPETILSVFTTDQSIIQASSPLLVIIAVTIYPIAVNVVIGHAIRGYEGYPVDVSHTNLRNSLYYHRQRRFNFCFQDGHSRYFYYGSFRRNISRDFKLSKILQGT